ncbi:FkbM family methyltransferase [Amycolatopsis balhimycina DSM 5908]|uniref:FkbM family methyltransferase n=1 Tax=Amycolatopsis balhimycina DSM 5908 TaxID=1081091 RepID=A0A428W346_AMYBA|nr:FkbM family methyltransferase [Amycolatopsis balhimycina]RSM37508.1 FkbM family methyltransferase [Amycolatopsis balhimycina DSM 5908]
MGIERSLRNFVVRTPLAESRFVGGAYATLNRIRFRRSWDRPVEFRGSRFVIGRDLTLYPFVRAGGFEERELDWLLPRIKPGDVVWDVGANVGIYTVLLAKRARRVVAFEPIPATMARLRANIGLNGIDNAEPVEAALADEAGRRSMAVLASGAGGSHLVRDGGGSFEVAVTTGDRYAAEHGAPDVVKVDIESFEPEFVRGASAVLRDRRPLLTLEVNRTSMATAAERERWQAMADDLFGWYGEAVWFGPSGPPVTLRGLTPDEVPLRPCTLAFGRI